MKKVHISLFLLFLSMQLLGSNNPDACVGTWLTGAKKGHIQIYKQGDKYFGKIVWLKEPNDPTTGKPLTDSKTPDMHKKNRHLLGLVNLSNFKYKGNNTWEDGKIYDPETGKEYSCKLKLTNPNQLDVRGFIGVSFIGRTDRWERVK